MKTILKFKIAVFTLLLAGYAIVMPAAEPHWGTFSGSIDVTVTEAPTDEKEIFKLVNKERRRYRLGDLDWDEDLERLATMYSRKMAKEHFFSHYERNGADVVDRAKAMNIRNWRKIGENLFMANGYRNINKTAVDKWMQSPGHRENILDGEFTDTGIGFAEAADGTVYITQVFTRKR